MAIVIPAPTSEIRLPGESAREAVKRLEATHPWRDYDRLIASDAGRKARVAAERTYGPTSHISESDLMAGYRGLRKAGATTDGAG